MFDTQRIESIEESELNMKRKWKGKRSAFSCRSHISKLDAWQPPRRSISFCLKHCCSPHPVGLSVLQFVTVSLFSLRRYVFSWLCCSTLLPHNSFFFQGQLFPSTYTVTLVACASPLAYERRGSPGGVCAQWCALHASAVSALARPSVCSDCAAHSWLQNEGASEGVD